MMKKMLMMTSAALLVRLIRALGHDADSYIPDRLLEGYGPSGEALVRLAARSARNPSRTSALAVSSWIRAPRWATSRR